MDYGKQRELLEAIKSDDVKRYAALADGRVGSLRMGRFPVLSLFYLYDAKKLTSLYEDEYVGNNGWEELPEFPELSAKFQKVAGKALRLYQNEVVSPMEMALLVGKTGKVRRLVSAARLTAAQKNRMVSLYSVNYSLPLRFTDRGAEFPNPPMGYEKKKKLFLSVASLFLVVALLISTPFVVNVFVPFIGVETAYDEEPVDPTPDPVPDVPTDEIVPAADFSEIDFASTKAYKLTSDVVLPAGFFVETVNCTLDGDGKKVTSTGGCSVFGTIAGTVKNIDFFISSGTWETSENFSFVAQYNRGVMEDLTLTVSGKLVVRAAEEKTQDQLYLGGFALSNTAVNNSTGIIKNCSAQYDLIVEGERVANASFAGVCAVNNRLVQECVVSGAITTEDCDVGGICVENGYLLYQDVNRTTISQSTSEKAWSPLCAGVVLKNVASFYTNSTVRECENEGAVSVRSEYRSEGAFEDDHEFAGAESGGIVGTNEGGAIYDCTNSGAVTATSVECVSYAGGICAMTKTISSGISTPTLNGCVNAGGVTVETERTSGFAAGICAVGQNATYSGCLNESSGKVTLVVTACEQENVIGGACGVVVSGNGSAFSGCKNEAEIVANTSVAAVYVGGIAGISSTVSGSENSGSVSVETAGTTAYVGGLVARANGNVTRSQSRGETTVVGQNATVHLGGLVGYTVFSVSECYATGSLTATGSIVYLGGAAGLCAIEDYASYGQTYVYCGKVSDTVADCALVANEGEKAYVGGVVGYVRHKAYSYQTTDENGDPIQKESVFAGGVTGSYSLGTLASGENGYLGGVAGGVDRRLAEENETNKYFNADGYLSGSGYQGVGAYCDDGSVSAGGDLNATPYVLREEMEALDAVRAVLSLFTQE